MPERMTPERLRCLLDAYGADAARWPAAERGPARALLEASPVLQGLRREAKELDALLDQAALPEVDGELLADLLATAGAPAWGRWVGSLWPFGPVWKPALGLTMAAVTGAVLGLVIAPSAEIAQITQEIEGLILG